MIDRDYAVALREYARLHRVSLSSVVGKLLATHRPQIIAEVALGQAAERARARRNGA